VFGVVFAFIIKKNTMSNTYHQIYIHAIFAVKYREALLESTWRKDVFAVIGNLINTAGCNTIIVNGVDDHVHCLFSLKPTVVLCDLMQRVKAISSKYINDHKLTQHHFNWQEGYGAFSHSYSAVPKVKAYVENQEIHHQKETFHHEFKAILNRLGILFEEAYLFEKLI
jgi:putative transposase